MQYLIYIYIYTFENRNRLFFWVMKKNLGFVRKTYVFYFPIYHHCIQHQQHRKDI